MRLSKNFTLEEFTRSDAAKRLGIKNTPSPDEIENLRLLCEHILQPLREAWGDMLFINSGYRKEALNKAVGGVTGSQHTKGQAADVRCSNPIKLLQTLKDLNIPFDQAIVYPSFLHISYDKNGNRNQVIYSK